MLFHGVGSIRVLITASQNEGYMAQGAAPLLVHLVLDLGFLIVFARHESIKSDWYEHCIGPVST